MEVLREANQGLSTGEGAREADRHHRRFRAGAGEPHYLRRRDEVVHPLRPDDFQLMRCAVVRPALELPGDGLLDGRVVVAQQQRAVAEDVIDEAVAVDVPFVRALRALDVDRERLEVADVVRDAIGQERDALSCS